MGSRRQERLQRNGVKMWLKMDHRIRKMRKRLMQSTIMLAIEIQNLRLEWHDHEEGKLMEAMLQRADETQRRKEHMIAERAEQETHLVMTEKLPNHGSRTDSESSAMSFAMERTGGSRDSIIHQMGDVARVYNGPFLFFHTPEDERIDNVEDERRRLEAQARQHDIRVNNALEKFRQPRRRSWCFHIWEESDSE